MVKRAVPSPEQVRAYLTRHGWVAEDSPPEDVTQFTFSELSDDGNPLTVFVPSSPNLALYPLSVRAVVVTAAGMQDRDDETDEVWAEMLATDPASVAPAAPAPAPHANGSATDAKGVPTP